MAFDLEKALEWIERLEHDGQLARYYLLYASKADLLRRVGRQRDAAVAYERAIALATNPAEVRYLARRMSELTF
jgi:RNA polymerase sigma-70 factor (ECF subfamily)